MHPRHGIVKLSKRQRRNRNATRNVDRVVLWIMSEVQRLASWKRDLDEMKKERGWGKRRMMNELMHNLHIGVWQQQRDNLTRCIADHCIRPYGSIRIFN